MSKRRTKPRTTFSVVWTVLLAGVLTAFSDRPAAAQTMQPSDGTKRCQLTLVDALQEAVDSNQALLSAKATLDAQRRDIAIARSALLPSLDGKGQGQVSEQATFSSTAGVIPERTINVSGVLNWAFYDQSNIDTLGAQKHTFESQREQLQSTLVDTIALAGQDYVSVLLQRALLIIQELNLQLTRGTLDVTRAQEAAGAVPFRDTLRWEAQQYANEQSIANQAAQLLSSRFALNQTRNQPAEDSCKLADISIDEYGFVFASETVGEAASDQRKALVIRDYLVEIGLARSPTLKRLDAQLLAQNRTLKANRRWLIPSLSGGAGAQRFLLSRGTGADQNPSGSVFWRIGLDLNWSIIDGGFYIASMRQAKAEFGSLEFERDSQATILEQQIRSTAAVAIASFATIGLAEQQVRTATENYSLVNEAYLDGATSILDLLDAQQTLLSANNAYQTALYQFFSDLIELEQDIAYFPFFEEDADARVRELETRLGQ